MAHVNGSDKSLESWIWDAACSIRGAQEAPKFKDFILPLIFTKRLCAIDRLRARAGRPDEAAQQNQVRAAEDARPGVVLVPHRIGNHPVERLKRRGLTRTKRDDAREKLVQRTRDWAARLEERVRTVTIRKMRRKWASCSTAGRLTFDESLLSKSKELQDYVIVHELLHLRVPNHGKLWKSLMRAYLGDFEALEARLRRRAGDE